MNGRNEGEGSERGLLWKLPVLKSKRLGRLGPGFGLGAGCGLGFGVGLVGGAGFGPGIPGLLFGFGFGAGCGVGLGFGYGIGRGIAYDENRKYSNVGKLFHGPGNFPSQCGQKTAKPEPNWTEFGRDDIGALVDELVASTKKVIRATSTEIEKWRR